MPAGTDSHANSAYPYGNDLPARLTRSDHPAEERLTTIAVNIEDGGHEITVSEAAQLASLLLTQVARAIGN